MSTAWSISGNDNLTPTKCNDSSSFTQSFTYFVLDGANQDLFIWHTLLGNKFKLTIEEEPQWSGKGLQYCVFNILHAR